MSAWAGIGGHGETAKEVAYAQLWDGIRAVHDAECVVGLNPLVAESSFELPCATGKPEGLGLKTRPSALLGRGDHGCTDGLLKSHGATGAAYASKGGPMPARSVAVHASPSDELTAIALACEDSPCWWRGPPLHPLHP